MRKKILLLEDDYELGDTLKELLESEGYDTTLARDGDAAVDASYENSFDLYVFDINVPHISGLELLESLRGVDDNTPAIFISALVDLNSITKGFAVGAEDYIKKPFYPEELLIRINAKFIKKADKIRYGDIEYDPVKKIVWKQNHIVSLGDVQERLADIFMSNIGQILDKNLLLDCLENPSPTALRVALNKLKNKTGLEIKNVRGIGYVLEAC